MGVKWHTVLSLGMKEHDLFGWLHSECSIMHAEQMGEKQWGKEKGKYVPEKLGWDQIKSLGKTETKNKRKTWNQIVLSKREVKNIRFMC